MGFLTVPKNKTPNRLSQYFGGLVTSVKMLFSPEKTAQTFRSYDFCVFVGIYERTFSDLGETKADVRFDFLVPFSSENESLMVPLPAITSDP